MKSTWLLLAWIAAASAGAFLLFGFDKWRAGCGGRRVAESTLWWVGALGGWPGGLLGLIFFRHKSAKPAFRLKYAVAFLVWAGLLTAAWRLAGGTLMSTNG